jgi:hypothetical protein
LGSRVRARVSRRLSADEDGLRAALRHEDTRCRAACAALLVRHRGAGAR